MQPTTKSKTSKTKETLSQPPNESPGSAFGGNEHQFSERLLALKESLMLGCSPDEAILQMDQILKALQLQQMADQPPAEPESRDEESIDLFDQELHDEINAAFLDSEAA